MSSASQSDQKLIDRFVESLQIEQTYTHESPPPEEFSVGMDPNDWATIRWEPVRISHRVEQEERKKSLRYELQIRLPPLYEQLVASWCWLNASMEQVELFPNLSGKYVASLVSDIKKDPVIDGHLVANGIIPFGTSTEHFYDPICFDTTRRAADGDSPVVRYEHEAMLSFDRKGESCELWPDSRSMMQSAISSVSNGRMS